MHQLPKIVINKLLENKPDPIIQNYRNWFRFGLTVDQNGYAKVSQDEFFLINFFHTYTRVNDPNMRGLHLSEVFNNQDDI